MVCYSIYCLILVSASVLARDKQDFFMSCEYNREKQVLDSKTGLGLVTPLIWKVF